MKKTLITIFIFILFSLSFIKISANSNITLEINDQILSIDYIDPVQYNEETFQLIDTAAKNVIYTPFWHYTTTKTNGDKTEYIVIVKNNKHVITKINNDGNSYIPLNGYVISLNKDHPYLIQTDDVVINTSGFEYIEPLYAIENQKSVRTAITNENTLSNEKSITLFNNAFSGDIPLRYSSSNLLVKYDSNEKSFIVDKVGLSNFDLIIPDDGFLVSAYLSDYKHYFNNNIKYDVGDIINIVNNPNENEINEIITSYHGENISRLENYLVLYTYNYDKKTVEGYPDTNGYGYEVAISDEGVVIDTGIHAAIPKDGFVLSGHGTNEDFLEENIKVGSLVSINTTTKELTITNDSVSINYLTFNNWYTLVFDKYQNALTKLYDIDFNNAKTNIDILTSIKDEIEELKTNYYLNENNKFESLLIEIRVSYALKKLLETEYYLMESKVLESRGIWHRPNERSLAEIESFIDKLVALNINTLYIETVYNSYSAYPSEYFDTHIHVANGFYGEYGKDYLKALIDVAHKNGIEVHAWVHVLRARMHNEIIKNNQDWLIESLEGEKNITYYGEFMDPTNPEVLDYINGIVNEILTNYDVDGFQLDYIRYPAPFESPDGKNYISGFTANAMNKFKEKYNLDGDVRQLINDNTISANWNQFKQDAVTELVRSLTQTIRNYPNVKISIDVSPVPEIALRDYMQDWTKWISNGWIDIILPMIYLGDTKSVFDYSKNVSNYVDNYSFQYTGIGPVYYGYPVKNNQDQIEALKEFGIGFSIFDTITVLNNEEFMEVLPISTNRFKAISPNSDRKKIVEMQIDDIIDKIERIYFVNGYFESDKKDALISELSAIKELNVNNALELFEVIEKILIQNDYLFLYTEGESLARISELLLGLVKVLDIHVSRDLINRNYWNPEVDQTRPDPTLFEYEDDFIEEEPITKNNKTTIIIIVSSAIVLIGGAIGFVILKKQK